MESDDGFVFIEYIFEHADVEINTNGGRITPAPSVMQAAREALKCRTTRAAKRVLKENDVNVGKRTVRLCTIIVIYIFVLHETQLLLECFEDLSVRNVIFQLSYLAPKCDAILTKRGPSQTTGIEKLLALANTNKDMTVKCESGNI